MANSKQTMYEQQILKTKHNQQHTEHVNNKNKNDKQTNKHEKNIVNNMPNKHR